MSNTAFCTREWLEADGLGGFASGSSTGIRTRRYHALLLTALTPPTRRVVLVNGFEAWVETDAGVFYLSSQSYAPGVIGGDGAQRVEGFSIDPWPQWIFKLEDDTRIEFEVFVAKDRPVTCLSWKLLGPRKNVRLCVRPFVSGRDYHALHHCNGQFRFEAETAPERVSWRPYQDLPGITAITNGRYSHQPNWYYNFLYEEERERGLDCTEDLAAPGLFSWQLHESKAVLAFTTDNLAEPPSLGAAEFVEALGRSERKRRNSLGNALERAADAYIVKRGAGKTIVAGYPWFTDWGRDTFIALRGLCLATKRFDVAREILLAWAPTVSEGMLPNRFTDAGEQPEYNSVDASLWFVVGVHEYLSASRAGGPERKTLLKASKAIVEGYARGTRFGIQADADGLLKAGAKGLQLTWMDAKVGDHVITPRIGKPVEIQALWLNALWIASKYTNEWKELFERALLAFRSRFWNQKGSCLFDVIDVDHQARTVDATIRPNQILAVGGLPLCLLEPDQARAVVATVEEQLLTHLGLRSLAPSDPRFQAKYEGGVWERDSAYHQGTVWPWLIGAFVEAWVRVHGNTDSIRRQARSRFLGAVFPHLHEAGLGHISEITDAEPPFLPRGCPWQAWSLGEVLRLDRVVLADKQKATKRFPAKNKASAHTSL